MQRRLLYHPSPETPSEDEVRAADLAVWPKQGDSFRGYINQNIPDGRPGFIVVFHGNAGTALDREYYTRMLGALGRRVLLTEYPAYGGRKGDLSEKSLVEDARATVRSAHRRFGGPVTVVGESLGCGVATGVAADPKVPVDAILLITPWNTLPDLARKIYWFLPARWLIRDKFDNIRNLEDFRGRVAVVVAEYDEVIPRELGLKLYTTLPNEKRLWTFENAGHNSWHDRAGTAWWREVMGFLERTNQSEKSLQ
jgi:pimeloyl-ACP methyl ester carboxylesterase